MNRSRQTVPVRVRTRWLDFSPAFHWWAARTVESVLQPFASHISCVTVRIADGRSISTEYSIQSRDGNGNYVVVDSKGNPSNYAIAGNKLINPAPEVNFVSVYVRQ